MKCPECDGELVLRYSRKFGKPFYGCTNFPRCHAAHGAHPDGRPLGVPADAATKRARIAAHEAFDLLWKGGPMRRGEAYQWLQASLHLSPEDCHIGSFNREQCERVVAEVQARLGQERP